MKPGTGVGIALKVLARHGRCGIRPFRGRRNTGGGNGNGTGHIGRQNTSLSSHQILVVVLGVVVEVMI